VRQSGLDGPIPVDGQGDPPRRRPPGRALTFPIHLRCLSGRDALISNELEDAVARALGRAFGRAQRMLPAADVLGSGVLLQAPELVKGELPPHEEAALFGRLGRAIERAAQSQALPLHRAAEASPPSAMPLPTRSIVSAKDKPPAKSAKKADQYSPWRIQIKVEFHITPRQFFEIRKQYAPRRGLGSPDPVDLLELYFPLLDKPMPATAWVVEAQREYDFIQLSDEVIRRFGVTRRPSEYVWGVSGWGRLRALIAEADRDHKVAGRVPEFGRRGFVENRPGPTEGEQSVLLRPGAWIFSAFLPLPNLILGDLVELKPLQTVKLPLSEAGPLFTPEAFAAEVGVDWATAVREAPDFQVAVVTTAFEVLRKVHERALATLLDQYRRATFNGTQLGCVIPLTESALRKLGPTLDAFLGALADPSSSGQRGPAAGWWLPGTAGVNLTPLLAEDLQKQILRKANVAFISTEADEAQRILQLENTFWSAERSLALEKFIRHWRRVNKPALFALLLDELTQRGSIDAFFSAVRGLPSIYTYDKRTVVALAADTGYANDSRVLAVAHDIEVLVRGIWKCHYDVEAQEIWIDSEPNKKVHAANESSDDKVGVVAEVEPYYSETSRILQPKPEILDRLREPTRKKAAELIGRMVCTPGERLTPEELLQKATQEAAKELPPLEEKDLVKVTLRKSIRLLKLESRVVAGVQEIYVHYQPVQKVGDNPWMPAGDVITQGPAGFEAYLTFYHVQHLESALTVFLLAEAVVLGAVMIIELGVASLGQLFFFVSVQVVVYRFTTDADDRTVEGYLTAALKGELDAVGFKLLSGAVKELGGFAAGWLVTGKLVGQVATKWIVYGLRGILTAAGVGGLEVTYQFAEDLLHYSHCQGWSSPRQYWDRFKTGFLMTLAFEFVGVPILAPPARLALEKASTVVEAARALRASGKSLREITEVILKGSNEVELAIAKTVQHDAGPAIARAFRERATDVLKALGREYESRAYSALLDLYGPELSGKAAEGLQRLIKTASEKQIDTLLQRLLAGKASPADLLGALGNVDEALIADLLKAGKLAEAGVSQRVLAVLTQDPKTGAQLLNAPFKAAPAELERFLERLEPLPPDARQSVLGALASDQPLPPEVLLGAAKQVGVLDEPTLALLRQLHDAKVRVGALFDGSGPSLKQFTDEFAKLSQVQRVAALENAAGRKPAQVLERAKAQPEPAEARPPAPTARSLDEIVRELEGKGFTRDDLRLFMGDRERLSAALARRVARLLDHFTPEEVRAFGEFLAKHKVHLNEKTVERLLTDVPRGKLEETIGELERIQTGGEAPGAKWSEEELAERVDVTIHPGKPPPLREIVETPASQALRASLIERAGGVEPPPGYHAHHIIPEKEFGPGLDWMRERLRRAGSGINQADNGAFLAGSKATANPELTRLHNSYIHAGPSKEYAYTLTRRLANRHGAEFLAEVEKIGKEMAEGKFKTLEIPHGWKTKWEPGMTAPIDPKIDPEWIEE
jgi:hypothetical protein